MAKQDLAKLRTDQINQLKDNINALTDYFNQAFTGNMAIKRQNEIVDDVLGLCSSIQQNTLLIREYNTKMVINHAAAKKLQSLKAMESSYNQIKQAMSSLQNVMALGDDDDPVGLIDNTSYSGPVNNVASAGSQAPSQPTSYEEVEEDDYADDAYDEANYEDDRSESSNFSQPSESSATYDDDDNEDLVDDSDQVEEPEQHKQSVEPRQQRPQRRYHLASQPRREQPIHRPVQTKTTTPQSQAPQAKHHSTFGNHPVSDNKAQPAPEGGNSDDKKSRSLVDQGQKHVRREKGNVTTTPSRSAEDDVQRQVDEEFKRHQREAQRHPERIKRRLAKVKHPGMAIKFAGEEHFVTKDGQILNDSKTTASSTPGTNEIRDVTPKSKKKNNDQDQIDDILNTKLDEL